MIHPTAIIDPEARLGSQVAVGPHAVIEGPVQIGDGCEIQAHAVITGHVIMGSRNVIGYGAIIGGEPQDFAFRPEVCSAVHIGDGNRIREYCTIHRGSKENTATVVGDGCYLMAGAHLAHNVRLGDRVVIANNALLGGYVQVEEGVFIGGGCVFHQFIRVGRLAICQGASAFSKDIPPYTMAAERNSVAGLNIVGMRRAGFSLEQRAEVKQAFALLYRSSLNVSQALAAARERAWGSEARAFFDFVGAGKKRGHCGFLASRKNKGGSSDVDAEGYGGG
jgi:UDP-N-acetylglucosamine acyltransferase